MKWYGFAATACLIACGLAGCRGHDFGDDYVPYVPIERRPLADPPAGPAYSGPAYWESPELLTSEHAICIQAVFKRYGVPYEIRSGRVYIPKSVQNDKEMLYNYGIKAEDLSEAEAREYLRGLEIEGQNGECD